MTFVHGDDAGTERALRLVLAQRSPAAIPVTEVEAWLLAAAVSLRAERRTSARESLGAALSVAETAGIVRPFRYAESGVRQLMLDQIGLGRTWETGPLEHPLGRGLNLQCMVEAIDPILERLGAAGIPLYLPVETKTYRVGDRDMPQRQFCVQDPDGYRLEAYCGAAK